MSAATAASAPPVKTSARSTATHAHAHSAFSSLPTAIANPPPASATPARPAAARKSGSGSAVPAATARTIASRGSPAIRTTRGSRVGAGCGFGRGRADAACFGRAVGARCAARVVRAAAGAGVTTRTTRGAVGTTTTRRTGAVVVPAGRAGWASERPDGTGSGVGAATDGLGGLGSGVGRVRGARSEHADGEPRRDAATGSGAAVPAVRIRPLARTPNVRIATFRTTLEPVFATVNVISNDLADRGGPPWSGPPDRLHAQSTRWRPPRLCDGACFFDFALPCFERASDPAFWRLPADWPSVCS